MMILLLWKICSKRKPKDDSNYDNNEDDDNYVAVMEDMQQKRKKSSKGKLWMIVTMTIMRIMTMMFCCGGRYTAKEKEKWQGKTQG